MAPAVFVLVATLAYGVWCRTRYRDPNHARSMTVAVVQGNIPNS
jgi:apolipoprotein N-acyltransferase